jgi:hypothetical protein
MTVLPLKPTDPTTVRAPSVMFTLICTRGSLSPSGGRSTIDGSATARVNPRVR